MNRFVSLVLYCGFALAAACAEKPEARQQRHFQNGNRFADQGQCREAVVEYRNVTQINPRFGPARARLAECYARLGDDRNALGEYVRAADLLPDDANVQIHAARYLLAARRPQDALARADAALKLQPDHVEAHILRGNALGGTNDLPSALAELEEAIRLDPQRGATYTHMALLRLAGGQRAEAETAFVKAVTLDPKFVRGHLALANYYWAVGKQDQAAASFKTALTLEPDNALVNRALAAFSLGTGQHAEAEQYLKKVRDITKSPSAVFALADFYLAQGRVPAAIELLTPLAAQPNTATNAKHRLAQAYAAQRDRAKAHTVVDELLKANPRDSEAQLLKGGLLLADGQRDSALSRVRAAVDADPQSVRAQFALGRLHRERGDVAAAERAFSEVIRLNPRAAAAQAELSRLQLTLGKPKESLRFAEEAARSQPQNLDARVALAGSLLASREYDRADREITSLLADYPNLARAHTYAGVLAGAKNDRPAARAAFERALAIEPQSTEALAGLISLDLAARDTMAARKRIEARLAEPAPGIDVLLLGARTYAAIADGPSAERLLRRVIETDATRLPAYGMLAQLYLSQRRLDDARREFEAMAQRQERPVAPLTMAGIILQSQGDTAQARQRFERVLAIDPRAPVAANNLAWMHAESGDNLDLALQLAQTAVAEQPDTPAMMDTLGWVYYKKNQLELAVPLLTRCVAKEPTNPVYHFHLGLAYAGIGDSASARRSLKRALDLRRDFAGADEARRVLAGLDSGAGR